MRLLVSSLSRHLGQTDPGNVKNDVELILKLNEKYTELEVAKAKCRKDLPSDALDIDELTGVFNTRYLNKILIEEIARAEDHHTPLTMLMIEIDRFKPVNDTFGHLAGNDVLKSLADTIRSSVRPIDFAFRFGGDEFIVVLPGIGLDVGWHIGQNIRDRIGTSSFGLVGQLTVTVAACEHQAGEAPESFITRLDDAMFRAKRGGEDEGLSSVWAPVR